MDFEDIRAVLKDIPVIGPLAEGKDKVAVIRMAGVVADSAMVRRAHVSHHKYARIIDKAFNLPKLKAVALVINSPGGAPSQCALIGSHIRRLADEKDVPVFAFVEDVAASGGYWLACAGDEIYVQETSVVGSIGVITAGFGFDSLIRRVGVSRRVYTAGKEKDFLDPFREENPHHVVRLKDLQTNMHESFKGWVKARRGKRLKPKKDEDLMEGAFWTGADAISRGLADGIGDVRHFCHEKFGDDIKLIDFAVEPKWLSKLLPGQAQATLADGLVEGIIDDLENRASWSRYGF